MKKLIRPRSQVTWLARDRWQGAAGESMLAKINALPMVLSPLSAADVLIRGMYLMNDQPMHESYGWVRKFDAAAVAQTVPMVSGKPVLVNHATDGFDGLPIGRFFDAELETRDDGSTWMAALFFMLSDDEGQAFARRIDGGIITENSPTLEFDRTYCSVCGAEDLACDHVPGQLYDGRKCYAVMTDVSDFWEGSLAWAGRQKNTGFYVAAGREPSELVDVDEHFVTLAKHKGQVELVTPFQHWWNGSPGT